MNLSPLYIIKNGSCGSWYDNTVGIISSYNKNLIIIIFLLLMK